MVGLTSKQVGFFETNGYHVLPEALDPSLVARFGEIVDEWIAMEKGAEQSDDFFDLKDSHQPDTPRVRCFKCPVRNHPEFDARPLLGVLDFEEFNSDLVRGEPDLTSRMTDVPARIPLPSPPMDGSIYERQRILENRYFEVYGEKASEAAAE